jgi:uncharacterized protein with GYD domain
MSGDVIAKHKYVLLLKQTSHGALDFKGALDHVDGVRAELGQPYGITEICHVVTFGRYDMVIVVEATSNELVTAYVAELTKLGHFVTETLVGIDPSFLAGAEVVDHKTH